MTESVHRFEATGSSGEVSAVLDRPATARWLFLMGHGAGAGMRHPFMERMARELAVRDVASFRYQFPYMEAGRRRPDHGPVMIRLILACLLLLFACGAGAAGGSTP